MDAVHDNTDSLGGDDLAPNRRVPAAGRLHGSAFAEDDSHDQPQLGQSYDRVTAGGNSRLHAGNVYNNYYQVEPSVPSFASTHPEGSHSLKTFRRCLSFEHMETRLASIATAHPDTCGWIIGCPQFKRWRDHNLQAEHHGCLWIKGKPGAGKSTIMKNLLRYIETAEAGDKVVSFFFNARGATLERTTEGLYRSLLYQMAGDVRSPLTDLRAETIELYRIRGWPLELLKDLCRKALRQLASETKATIFIDALDEGNVEDDVRDMVTFVEELAAEAQASGLTLHICLASRHYPTISILHSELLILDTLGAHDEDITAYVQSQLRIDSRALRAKLVVSIAQRARAVFLWVVLVVKILNKEIDRGNQHLLDAKLQELPSGLHDLFDAILEKDAEYDPRLLPALLWVLFARKSLMPAELYFAIMVSTNQLDSENVVWDPDAVNQTVLTNFLLSSSMGLLEIVEYDRVQIIHESVREYLLLYGLRKLDKDLSLETTAKSHGRLAKWCSAYIEITVTHGLLGESDQPRAMRLCPLLGYVVESALEHAEMAARESYPQPTYTETSLETWRLIADIRNQRSELKLPTQTVHPRSLATLAEFKVEHKPVYTTMLHLLILQRLSCLVGIELELNAKRDAKERQLYLDAVCLRADEYGIGYSESGCGALQIAISTGDVGIVHALLREGADANACCRRHGSPLDVALCGISCASVEERTSNIHKVHMTRALLHEGADAHVSWKRHGSSLRVPLRRAWDKTNEEVGDDDEDDEDGEDGEDGENSEYDEYDGLPNPICDELEITHLLLQYGATSPIDRPLEVASPLLRAIETKDWDRVQWQMRDIPYGQMLIRQLQNGAYRLRDDFDQPLDRETVARSDGVEEMVDIPSPWVTDSGLSDSQSEIVAPPSSPQDHIAEPTVQSRVYHTLWGDSLRQNLPY
jgi:hypothetical protein